MYQFSVSGGSVCFGPPESASGSVILRYGSKDPDPYGNKMSRIRNTCLKISFKSLLGGNSYILTKPIYWPIKKTPWFLIQPLYFYLSRVSDPDPHLSSSPGSGSDSALAIRIPPEATKLTKINLFCTDPGPCPNFSVYKCFRTYLLT